MVEHTACGISLWLYVHNCIQLGYNLMFSNSGSLSNTTVAIVKGLEMNGHNTIYVMLTLSYCC